MQLTLKSPVIITPRLLSGVRVGGAFVSIEYAGVTSDRRTRYRYYIDQGENEHTGDDRKSGCGGGDLQHGLADLLVFLSAAAESYPDGENADLFPPEIVEWAYQNADEISCLACDLEETKNLIEER